MKIIEIMGYKPTLNKVLFLSEHPGMHDAAQGFISDVGCKGCLGKR